MSAEGRLITGRYRLEKQIGSGAMGVVWRAVDERLQRTVAVKQLLLQPGYTDEETEEARQRSMREGRIAARLQHQNAIAVFDVAEDEGQPVLVMEYLPSQSLAGMLSEQGLLPPVTVARIGAQVAGALAAAHQAGIVHRDLKPGNILLGDNGVSKITDFGISRAIGDVSVTKSGILAGTPAYLSPEVALGRDPAPASDVFSLGSTLYAAIEGEPPFGVDENAISLLHRVARGQVEPPRQAGPMSPALMQLLRADPVDRPTMAQVRGILQAVVDGRPVPSFPPSQQQAPRSTPAPAQVSAQAQQRDSVNTRLGSPTTAHPQAQFGEAAPAREKPRRAILLWTMAVVIAILVGIVTANAFSGGRNEGQATAQEVGKPRPAAQQQAEPAQGPPQAAPQPALPAPTSSSASSSPTSAAASTSVQQPSRAEIVDVVEKYFKLVPKHLDDSWSLLGPSLQAQGKERYASWWNSVDDVKIIGKPRLVGSKVLATLVYTAGGKRSLETHTLGMVASKDGKPLINTDNGH